MRKIAGQKIEETIDGEMTEIDGTIEVGGTQEMTEIGETRETEEATEEEIATEDMTNMRAETTKTTGTTTGALTKATNDPTDGNNFMEPTKWFMLCHDGILITQIRRTILIASHRLK